MSRSRFFLPAVTLLTGLLVAGTAFGCLWDHDTLKMERARFPTTLELITGKFLRHSPEFYRWRIDNRLTRLASTPGDAALLDDLAVAYDKVGEHEKAIATAMENERRNPGRYETAANLGTFLMHAGRFEEGLAHVERALRINPNAHFGREKYQKLLVEYVHNRRKNDPRRLPLSDTIPTGITHPRDSKGSQSLASATPVTTGHSNRTSCTRTITRS